MEMAFSAVIIAVVMSMAVWFGMRLIPMIQTLDALSLTSGSANEEIIYHAVHGRWPPPDDASIVAGNNKSAHVDNITLDGDGVITAQLAIGPGQMIGAARSATEIGVVHGSLSFRPELLGSPDAPTISFLCGYAKPVIAPVAPNGTNRTTLDKHILPLFCR